MSFLKQSLCLAVVVVLWLDLAADCALGVKVFLVGCVLDTNDYCCQKEHTDSSWHCDPDSFVVARWPLKRTDCKCSMSMDFDDDENGNATNFCSAEFCFNKTEVKVLTSRREQAAHSENGNSTRAWNAVKVLMLLYFIFRFSRELTLLCHDFCCNAYDEGDYAAVSLATISQSAMAGLILRCFYREEWDTAVEDTVPVMSLVLSFLFGNVLSLVVSILVLSHPIQGDETMTFWAWMSVSTSVASLLLQSIRTYVSNQ